MSQQDAGQQGQGALQASQPQAGAGASNMVKLFVGQIPKDMNEEALRPIFAEHGTIFDLAIIRDKATGHHRGCAFLTYTTKQAADIALDNLHNKLKLPGAQNPLQVRGITYAEDAILAGPYLKIRLYDLSWSSR